MASRHPFFRMVLIVSLSLVVFLPIQSPLVEAAGYDYVAPQIAPAAVADTLTTMGQIVAILNETAPPASAEDPPYALFQLTTWDEATQTRASAAPLKVVATDDARHPFLGVFHNPISTSQFATYLGYSADLKSWYTLGQIHSPASQPDLRILADDSVLYAEEYNPTGHPHVRVHYYGNAPGMSGVQALIANPAAAPTKIADLPGTALAKADGTPEFARISYGGSISSSRLEITHHYFYLGRRDLEGVDVLTNFTSNSNSSDTIDNNLVTDAGGNGKIGDREIFKIGSQVYEVVEAQVNPSSGNDYGSWRLFLINKTTNEIQQLSPALAGGAQSLGNPTVSFVSLPNGAPALVFTCFIFGSNNGTTPPGGHLFVYPFNPPH
jgi:hypothetical protein